MTSKEEILEQIDDMEDELKASAMMVEHYKQQLSNALWEKRWEDAEILNEKLQTLINEHKELRHKGDTLFEELVFAKA